jgi:hypothetical protein
MGTINEQLYWTVGNKRFTNKWQALFESKKHSLAPQFYFFDNEFSTYNWSVEPSDSWDTLLLRRATQLRESYDYIRLFYSGGVDSQTMLETFLDNKIKIDEILVYRGSAFTDRMDDEPADIEIKEVALPYLKSIEVSIPETKITILESGASYLNKTLDESYFYEESTFALRIWCERHLYKREPKLFLPFEKGLKHCDLRGGDKPKVFLENGSYFMAMWDSSRIWDIGDKFLENFYLSPEMPEVHAKQCHIVKNFFKLNYPNETSLKRHFNVFDESKLEIINQLCRKPRFREVNLGKGSTGILSSKQVLVQEGARRSNPRLYNLWMSFIENEANRDPQRFNNDNILEDFKGILSKKYPLE